MKRSFPPFDWMLVLPFLRHLLNYCLLVVFVFLVDYWILPTQVVTDQVEVQHRYAAKDQYGTTVEYGGTYKTQTGLSFGTEDFFYPEFVGNNLQIEYSPLFRTVKDVYLNGKSYRTHLNTFMHGISSFFHGITVLVLIGGRLVIWDKTRKETINGELVMQIVMHIFVYGGISLWLAALFG